MDHCYGSVIHRWIVVAEKAPNVTGNHFCNGFQWLVDSPLQWLSMAVATATNG